MDKKVKEIRIYFQDGTALHIKGLDKVKQEVFS